MRMKHLIRGGKRRSYQEADSFDEDEDDVDLDLDGGRPLSRSAKRFRKE